MENKAFNVLFLCTGNLARSLIASKKAVWDLAGSKA